MPKRTNPFSASVHLAFLATRLARPIVGGSRLELMGDTCVPRGTRKTQGYALSRWGSAATHPGLHCCRTFGTGRLVVHAGERDRPWQLTVTIRLPVPPFWAHKKLDALVRLGKLDGYGFDVKPRWRRTLFGWTMPQTYG